MRPSLPLLCLLALSCQRSRVSEIDDQKATAERALSPPGATGPAVKEGEAFKLKSSGIRCMAAPCAYFLASDLTRPGEEPIQVHELNWQKTGASEEQIQKWTRTLDDKGELTVAGHIGTRVKAGPAGDATVLNVARVDSTPPQR